jgi:hypothetical protein
MSQASPLKSQAQGMFAIELFHLHYRFFCCRQLPAQSLLLLKTPVKKLAEPRSPWCSLNHDTDDKPLSIRSANPSSTKDVAVSAAPA